MSNAKVTCENFTDRVTLAKAKFLIVKLIERNLIIKIKVSQQTVTVRATISRAVTVTSCNHGVSQLTHISSFH